MVKCIFCGKEESPHRGLHLFKNDGSLSYFCSSKCRKNTIKLKRDKRKMKWTEAFHITRDKANVKIAEKAEQAKNKLAAVKA